MESAQVGALPSASRETCAPPPVISRIASGTPSGPFTQASAPNARARSRAPGDRSTATTRAPAAAAIITGGNTAGTLAEATRTSLNSAAASGFGLAAMAPMSHTTGRWASRLVDTTSRRRPRRCSAATRARNSGVT